MIPESWRGGVLRWGCRGRVSDSRAFQKREILRAEVNHWGGGSRRGTKAEQRVIRGEGRRTIFTWEVTLKKRLYHKKQDGATLKGPVPDCFRSSKKGKE